MEQIHRTPKYIRSGGGSRRTNPATKRRNHTHTSHSRPSLSSALRFHPQKQEAPATRRRYDSPGESVCCLVIRRQVLFGETAPTQIDLMPLLLNNVSRSTQRASTLRPLQCCCASGQVQSLGIAISQQAGIRLHRLASRVHSQSSFIYSLL